MHLHNFISFLNEKLKKKQANAYTIADNIKPIITSSSVNFPFKNIQNKKNKINIFPLPYNFTTIIL